MSSSNEEEMRRKMNFMDFNKIEAQALIGFVEQTQKQSILMKHDSTRYRNNAVLILKLMEEKKLLHKLDLSNLDLSDFTKLFADAVDGSNQNFPKPDGNFIYFFSTSRIRYPEGVKSVVEVNVTPYIQSINKIDPTYAGDDAENFMKNMETETLKNAITSRKDEDNGLLFLDGPIIDPPMKIPSQDYLLQRTLSIKEAFRKKITVIGIVKRIMGDMFANHYQSYFGEKDKVKFQDMNSDKNFAVHVLTSYLSETKEFIGFTEPFIISEANPGPHSKVRRGKEIAEKYKEQGIDVLTFIMKNGYATLPIRVDVAVPTDVSLNKIEMAEKAIKCVSTWAAPGRQIPIPVILAHEKCNIRKGAAEILFTEFITGSKSDNEEENVIQIQMMGDVH